ncbi:unnamed protein product [Toxocara canis]|uniref:DUF1534 domain-containing protein n=1 Tax=Toxocara canis TaxID=6265 RepID=A0A183U816_TOXCA|nr:unnamed protein product [Toxocara canis]
MTFRRHFGMVVGGASQRERAWAERATKSVCGRSKARSSQLRRSGRSV